MIQIIDILIFSFSILLVCFSVFYLIALFQGIYNTLDIAYGTSFIAIAIFSLLMSDSGLILRKLVMTTLLGIWGIRIAYFLSIKKYGKDPITIEDKWLS
jgi:steroid 5-alpha reductase family enzyme